jgi:hypothetical protein
MLEINTTDKFTTQVQHIGKDCYRLIIFGVDHGEWDKSDIRHLIQKLDNGIHQ